MRTLPGLAASAAASLALVCAIAQAAEAGEVAAAPPESPAWLTPMAGAKLSAIDGSTMTLSPSEGGFALTMMAPNGAAQHSTFSFISDRIGTISDDADSGHVIGFFRETGMGIEAQFGDGRSQSFVLNNAGGISLTVHGVEGDTSCTSWYPANHVFGTAEKRAALDAYASRLGISEKKKQRAAMPVCAPPARKQAASKQTIAPASGPYKIGMYQAPAAANSSAAGLTPVPVRTSVVHTVDGAVAVPIAASSPPAATAQPAALAVQQSAPSVPAPTQVTLATAVATQVPEGRGASDCLTLESDGANIGFRNHCGYGVQFAYCLQRASDPAADCGAGAKAGAVSANGFALLLTDTNIKSADAERDFRWVACSGNAGSVVAHLDRADPPAGRCVLAKTS